MAKSLEVHADNGKFRMVGCAPPFQDGSHHNQCHGLKHRGTMAANPPGKRGAYEAVLAADGNPGVAWGTPAPQCQPPVRCVSGLPSRCLLLAPTALHWCWCCCFWAAGAVWGGAMVFHAAGTAASWPRWLYPRAAYRSWKIHSETVFDCAVQFLSCYCCQRQENKVKRPKIKWQERASLPEAKTKRPERQKPLTKRARAAWESWV